MTTYQPTGTGLCKVCGHDVGRHDAGHEWTLLLRPTMQEEVCCNAVRNDPIHDVGRVLRCPKEETP